MDVRHTLRLGRQLSRAGRQYERQSIPQLQRRCFSCSLRSQQAAPESNQPRPAPNEKYTHFGFETVSEDLKESKGKSYRLTTFITDICSCIGLLLGRLFLRCYERFHVTGYTSIMERSFRTVSRSRNQPPYILRNPLVHNLRHCFTRSKHPRHSRRKRGRSIQNAGLLFKCTQR